MTKAARGVESLRMLARAVDELRARTTSDRLAAMDWTRPQWDFLHSPARYKLLRTGNQLGKSTVGLAECVMHALGTHPCQRIRPPLEIWILFDSKHQSLPLQEKLWKLLPKDKLAAHQREYDPITGFGHHEPLVEFANGSRIRMKTNNQDGIGLAGGSPHHILLDEPPKPRVLAECFMRLRSTGGTMSLTLTPINRDCSLLRQEVEAGKIADLHYAFTAENLIQVKSGLPLVADDGEVKTAEWVETQRALAMPHEAPIVNDGEWDGRAVERLFDAFRSDVHVIRNLPGVEMSLCYGVDHGTQRGNQAAVLVAVDTTRIVDGYPTVYIMDEAWSPGMTTSDADAEATIGMLARHGLAWSDVDFAYGDIPTGTRGSVSRKGNYDLMDAIARKTKRAGRRNLTPQIAIAKRGENAGRQSIQRGEGWLHRRMVAGAFFVHERCTRTIEALENYDGRQDSEHKHILDAVRYSLYEWIMRGGPRSRTPPAHRPPRSWPSAWTRPAGHRRCRRSWATSWRCVTCR